HQLSFEKALQSIRNNYPPGKLPPNSEYANTYYNMSEGGEVRGSWTSDKHFEYVKDPQPGVDGGDGSASVGLTPEQDALCIAMVMRRLCDPLGDPLTGAELGAGKENTSSSAK
ncbi:manganese catalase family protein, partial [Klebsiella pneumoniae]|uniref:manganese catalase family protein n=1 Tax=Klebsiella pneumoniae TaxID=573 RepID=UPI00272F4AAF